MFFTHIYLIVNELATIFPFLTLINIHDNDSFNECRIIAMKSMENGQAAT
jgi:hypothetical protein